MTTEFLLEVFRVRNQRLWGKLDRAALLLAANRARIDTPLVELVDELVEGRLETRHARDYRRLLSAAATVTGRRVAAFQTTVSPDTLGPILLRHGAKFLGREWQTRSCPWPWLRRTGRVDWPRALHWSHDEATFRRRELEVVAAAAPSSGAVEEVLRLLVKAFKASRGASVLIIIDPFPAQE